LQAFVRDGTWKADPAGWERMNWDEFYAIARHHRLAGVIVKS